MTRSAPPQAETSEAKQLKEDPRLPIIDFHCHGGDASRTDEIAAYATSEGLEALVLLSLPLHGFPGYTGSVVTMNGDVLESLNHLEAGSRTPDGSGKGTGYFAFGSLDHSIDRPGAEQVAALADTGFRGLKLWEGKPEMAAALNLMPDSPFLVEACQEAGRRGMPVICHVADPPDFRRAGGRAGTGEISPAGGRITPAGLERLPAFDELIDSAGRLCRECPDTNIVFPHLLFLAGDLDRAASFLDKAPRARLDLAPGNYMFAELAACRSEAVDFFSAYRNRILFGSDGFFFGLAPEGGLPPDGLPFGGDSLEGNRTRCRRLRKFLEGSPSEVIENPYPGSRDEMPEVGCLGLDLDILELILAGNARQLLGGKST